MIDEEVIGSDLIERGEVEPLMVEGPDPKMFSL